MAYTGLEDAPVGATDIALVEVALGALPAGVEVVGYSANLGLQSEVLLAGIDVPGTRLFVAVVGASGAFSATPYALQVESSMPMLAAALSADPDLSDFGLAFASSPACDERLSISHGGSTEVLYDATLPGEDPLTLFVTQEDRLRDIYGLDAGAWALFLQDLQDLADHELVRGKIISISGGATVIDEEITTFYDYWDDHPCSVDAANAVTDHIRTTIADQMVTVEDDDSLTPTGIDYVVIVGNDDIIPFRRVPDQTIISNERLYLLNSFLEPGSPLFSALWGSYMLSDDFFVDMVATEWQGRALYVPDFPIGRLVETPIEIVAQARAFLLSDGVLDDDPTAQQGILEPSDALATGYDFFIDGTDATADALRVGQDEFGGGLDTIKLNNNNWTADELRCVFLDDDSGIPAGPAVPGSVDATDCGLRDVSAINAHFTHWAGVAANGFANNDFTDLLFASDVATAGNPDLEVPDLGAPALYRDIVFSIGCHAGYNLPDGSVASGLDPATLGFDPAMDFAQAMAIQRAIYVASTGFGLGDDEGIGGTEALMVEFAELLLSTNAAEGIAAGDALVAAKHVYLTSLASMTVYDEKSSVQTTLYGLPQYRVVAPGGVGADETLNVAQVTPPDETLDLTIIGGVAVPPVDLVLVTDADEDPDGQYYTADGDHQSTAGRPLQPRIVIDLPLEFVGEDPNPVHAVLVTGATFIDVGAGGVPISDPASLPFDPVIGRPTTEWEPDATEPQICQSTFWPGDIVTVNSLNTAGGLIQTLVITPGQFQCTSGDAATVTGIQRIYTSLTIELLRSPSPLDLDPPDVLNVDLQAGNSVDVIIDVADGDDVDRILILLVSPGGVAPAPLDDGSGDADLSDAELAAARGPDDTFTIRIADPAEDEQLLIYVCDANSNCYLDTGKGSGGASVVTIDAGIDQSFSVEAPTFFRAIVPGFDTLTGPVSYIWDFGDGTFVGGVLEDTNPDIAEFDVSPAGDLTFLVRHRYTSEADVTAMLRIADAGGGVGIDDVDLIPSTEPGSDSARADADILAGRVVTGDTTMTITVYAAGDIDFDNTSEEQDIQYRLQLDLGSTDPGTGLFDPSVLDSGIDVTTKFVRGAVQGGGLSSMVVDLVGTTGLAFTFDLAEIGRDGANRDLPIMWSMQTQVGEPGAGQVGLDDEFPDLEMFAYVLGFNLPPVAQADAYGVDKGLSLVVVEPGVLGNDSDADSDPLSVHLVNGPTDGVLILNPDGSFEYTPDAAFDGEDSFTYAASDGMADSNTVTVTINVDPVNDPPNAVADGATVGEGGTVSVLDSGATSVLANDTDPEGDTLSVSGPVSLPIHGDLTLNPDGSFSYTHTGADTASDAFTYEVCDDGDSPACSTAEVTIIVNDDPVANAGPDQIVDVSVPVTLDGSASSDPNGDTITFSWLQTSGPLVTLDDATLDGPSFDAPGVSAELIFELTVTDDLGGSDTDTVAVSVAPNNVPVFDGPSLDRDADKRQAINIDILDAYSDPDGDTLTLTIDDTGTAGSVKLEADGTVTYKSKGNFTGPDAFAYTVDDGNGGQVLGTVTVTVS